MVLSRGGFDPDPADIRPCLETFSVVTTGEGGASGRRPGVRLNVLWHAGHSPPQRIMNRKRHGETLVRRRNPEMSKISDSRATPKGRGGAGRAAALRRGAQVAGRPSSRVCCGGPGFCAGRTDRRLFDFMRQLVGTIGYTVFPSLGASDSHLSGGKSPRTRGRGDEGTVLPLLSHGRAWGGAGLHRGPEITQGLWDQRILLPPQMVTLCAFSPVRFPSSSSPAVHLSSKVSLLFFAPLCFAINPSGCSSGFCY